MKITSFFSLILVILIINSADAQSYKRGVLVEEFTSQYCPFSPRGDAFVDSVDTYMSQNAVSILWHNAYLLDDYSIKAGDTVAGSFGIAEVPHMLTNRSLSTQVNFFSNSDGLYTYLKKNAVNDPSFDIRIMNETYDPVNSKVECDVYVEPNSGTILLGEDSIQYSITSVMTEDKIVDWQWHDFAGTLDTLTHNNIVRVVGGKVLGDKISFKNSSVVGLHYTFSLAAKWNPSNMRIKAFISTNQKKKPFLFNVMNAVQTVETATAYPMKLGGKLTFLYPSAGDTLDPTMPLSIYWNQISGKEKDKMVLSYSSDDGITWLDIAPVSNSYSYIWNYPSEIKGKPIRLSIVDLSDTSLHSISGVFYVMKRGFHAITGVQISGGPEMDIGTSHMITWNVIGEVSDTVDIQLSIDGGLTYNTVIPSIATSLGSQGISWSVPSQTSSLAYIKVLSRDGIIGYSTEFTIVDKRTQSINNIHIVGLPNVLSSKDALITWDVSGNIGETVQISLSEYHDSGYSLIVTDLSVSGGVYNYLWHVPDTVMAHAYLQIRSSNGAFGYSQMFSIVNNSGVSEASKRNGYQLFQNYPNPFRTSTTISYDLSRDEHITLLLFDLMGKEVLRIYDDALQLQGTHEILINTGTLTHGAYILRLIASGKTIERKMIIGN